MEDVKEMTLEEISQLIKTMPKDTEFNLAIHIDSEVMDDGR